jgi:hypothetical protein
LEELLERVEVGSVGASAMACVQVLTELKDRCLQDNTVDRPDFATMAEELSSLG